MPMKTTLVTCAPRSSRRTRAKCRTWSTISSAVRSRRSPSRPEAQKAQPTAQPTCVETHTVARPATSMSTASTGWPSAVENSVLRAVPCVAARVSTSVSESGVSRSDNAFRSGSGSVRDDSEVGDQPARQRLVDLPRAIGGLAQIGQRGRDDVGIEHRAILRRAGNDGGEREELYSPDTNDPGTLSAMTTVQIIGIAVASLAVLLLIVALIVTRRRGDQPDEEPRAARELVSRRGPAGHLLGARQGRAARRGHHPRPRRWSGWRRPGGRRRPSRPSRNGSPQPGGLGLDWGPDLSVRTTGRRAGVVRTSATRRRAEITGELRPDETAALPPQRHTPSPRGGERRPGGRHAARAAR